MKILIVTDAWEPQINGVVRTLKMTTRELAALGHQVALITPHKWKSIPCPTYPEISLALCTPGMVAQRIDRFGPDCLHIATEGPLGWSARAVAMRRGWAFSTAYHSQFPEYVHMRVRVPLNWSYALLRRFHNRGVATMVPTPAMVERLRERGFERPWLWSRGVNTDMFRPDGPRVGRDERPVFLYVGRVAVEKQVDEFLKLDLPGQKWVAGEGPERARLERAYPGVRWFGFLSGEELATVYRSADVLVFPSRTDTFGLVMAESMACGTPVAAYPVTGPIDVIGKSRAGIMNEDLRSACLEALHLSRDEVTHHAHTFSWAQATRQFVEALRPVKSAGRLIPAN